MPKSGSLVGAASALNLNHSTVFRRLGALEAMIGAKLFERSRNGYAATAAGQEMVALAERMGRDVTDFERRIAGRDDKPSGLLRVTTNDALFNYVLSPVLASFRQDLPGYPARRAGDEPAAQPVAPRRRHRRALDLCAAGDPGRPADRLLGVGPLCVAHALRVRLRPVRRKRHAYIAFNEHFGGVDVFDWIEKEIPQHRIAMRCNTTVGLAKCIAEGMGIGFLPRFIGDQHPELVCTDEPMAGAAPICGC